MLDIGDILLVTGTRKTSKWLARSQKLLYSKASSSHVEFGMGDGVFIHATTGRKVTFTTITKELEEVKSSWRVIRLKGLSDDTNSQLQLNAYYFLAQDYNSNYFRPHKKHASYCSELVDKIYRRTGIQIFSRLGTKIIAPSHFDQLANENVNWLDVTDEYKSILATEGIKEQIDLCLLVHATMYRRAVSRYYSKQRMRILAKHFISKEKHQEIDDMFDSALSQRQFRFWTDEDQ